LKADDSRAPLVGCAQLSEHARMIGARVLTEYKDRIAQSEVVQ